VEPRSKLPPKKVFYLPNKEDKTHLAFETDVPLWPGSNLIQVFRPETTRSSRCRPWWYWPGARPRWCKDRQRRGPREVRMRNPAMAE